MASHDNVFAPNVKSSVSLSVGTVAAAIQFRAAPPSTGGAGDQPGTLAILNAGAQPAFVRLGTAIANLTATVPGAFTALGDYAIAATSLQIIDMGNAIGLAALTSTSTTTLYITPGQGGL